jgi:hypothetical protein
VARELAAQMMPDALHTAASLAFAEVAVVKADLAERVDGEASLARELVSRLSPTSLRMVGAALEAECSSRDAGPLKHLLPALRCASHASGAELGAPHSSFLSLLQLSADVPFLHAPLGTEDTRAEKDLASAQLTPGADGKREKKKKKKKKQLLEREAQLCTKLFIGGLGQDTDAQQLLDYFHALGKPVLRADILQDAKTGRSRGFGFVEFPLDFDDTNLHGEHNIDGEVCTARPYSAGDRGVRGESSSPSPSPPFCSATIGD